MIRAIYRWDVRPGMEETFVSAWIEGTQLIRAQIKGAQGSLLLRNHSKSAEFIAVARWDSFADWQAFSSAGLPDVGAFHRLAAVSTLVSTDIGEEILDLVEETTPVSLISVSHSASGGSSDRLHPLHSE